MMNFRKNANHRQRKAERAAIRGMARFPSVEDALDCCESMLERTSNRAQRDKRRWAA